MKEWATSPGIYVTSRSWKAKGTDPPLGPPKEAEPHQHLDFVDAFQFLSNVQLFSSPWTIAHQTSLSIGFSRQEYWSELPRPSPGECSQPRDRTQVSHVAGRFFIVCATREAIETIVVSPVAVTNYRKWSSLTGFPGGSIGKSPPAKQETGKNAGCLLGLGRSSGGGNGNPLQYSCLENPLDWRTWLATVQGITKNQTWLSMRTCISNWNILSVNTGELIVYVTLSWQ